MPSHKEKLVVFSRHARSLRGLLEMNWTPHNVVMHVLACLCEAVPPAFSQPEESWKRHLDAYCGWLCSMDHEHAIYWLGCLYSYLIPADQRKRQSVYFTPPMLTQPMLRQLCYQDIKQIHGHIVDPACGGGAFLVPALIELLKQSELKAMTPAKRIAHVEHHLHGSDIDLHLVDITCHLLDWVMSKDIHSAGCKPHWDLRIGNGLEVFNDLQGRVDIVLSNPPYRKLTQDEIRSLQDSTLHELCEGQFNLYGLFMAKALTLLRSGGCAGLITPMSYLSGKTFSKLRKRLIADAVLTDLTLVHQKGGIFYGAEQDAALTLLQKRCAQVGTRVSLVQTDGTVVSLGTHQIVHGEGPWVVPRRKGDRDVLRLTRNWSAQFSDYGYAIRVGNLVDYRDTRKRYARRVNTRGSLIPLLWDSQVQPNRLEWTPSGTPERPAWVASALDGTGVVRAPAVLIQRVSSPDQARRLVCAPLEMSFLKAYGGFVAENHVLILEAIAPKVPPTVLAELLNHPVVNRLFAMRSSATNVSAYELKSLPLPAVEDLPLGPVSVGAS